MTDANPSIGLILDSYAMLAYLRSGVGALSVIETMQMATDNDELIGLPMPCLVSAADQVGLAALEPLTVNDDTVVLTDAADWPLIMAQYRMTGDLSAAAAAVARVQHQCWILTDRLGLYSHLPEGAAIPVDHRGIPGKD